MSKIQRDTSTIYGEAGYERIKHDAYFTPPWCTEWLLNRLKLSNPVWEPACGAGHISKVLIERGYDVISTDLIDHGYGVSRNLDFLQTRKPGRSFRTIITNPPYVCAEQFIWHALKLMEGVIAPEGTPEPVVVMLLRQEYDCAKTRRLLFEHPSFARKYILTRRPPWIELNPASGQKRSSPRHNFAWYVWKTGHKGPPQLFYLP